MKFFRSLSIATRFNLLNVLLVLITAISVAGIVTYVQLAHQFQARYEQGQVLATLLAETSEYAVYTRQNSLLERQFVRLRKVSDLVYVVIVDDKGQTLAHMETQDNITLPVANRNNTLTLWQWLMEANQPHFMEIVQPIISSDFQDEEALFLDTHSKERAIGEVRLGISLLYFEEIVHYSLRLGLIVLLMILIIGISISVAMTAHITSPLKKVVLAAHDVIEGNIKELRLEGGAPELQELTRSFNLMINWLIDYRAEVDHYQRMLERQAYFDELTGLANRSQLKNQLHQMLNRSTRRRSSVALLFLDLDRFKYVNDTLGHSFGDQLLQKIAQCLRQNARDCDLVARMGGDEFIMILNELSSEKEQAKRYAGNVAKRISQVLSQPFVIGGHNINTSFSIGIALSPYDTDDDETLIRFADSAMYEAKRNGRNTFYYYEPWMQKQNVRRLILETNLKRALEKRQLIPFFQPKIDCLTHRVVGVEVLLRWHFGDEWVSPSEFIPLAEEVGLILPIGEWIMEAALVTLLNWRSKGIVDDDFHISVNVAVSQFWHPSFADRTLSIIAQYIPDIPSILELELTESCLLQSSQAVRDTFVRLKEAGVLFAVDDFGTGYSNLHYLKHFPLDTLKIDQSFIRDCVEDACDASIIRAIITMAKGLGLSVVAEGVETIEQVDFLQAEGCHLVQGYIYARPMIADDFVLFLQRFNHDKIVSLPL